MMQSDWLIALSLDSCVRLMMQFNWLIALGLDTCKQLMKQFDWLIAVAASSLSLTVSLPFVCGPLSLPPFCPRSGQSRGERERVKNASAARSLEQQLQTCHFRELSDTAISKCWHTTNLKLPNQFYLASNLLKFLATL